jgi:hypothetical protein
MRQILTARLTVFAFSCLTVGAVACAYLVADHRATAGAETAISAQSDMLKHSSVMALVGNSSRAVATSGAAASRPGGSGGPRSASQAGSGKSGTERQDRSGNSSAGGRSPQSLHCGSDPHLCGFPDATNTGPTGCLSYQNMSGNTEITADNTVISCVRLSGSFDVYANNVTIENSIITSENWWGINLRSGYGNLRVLHDTITGVAGQGLDNGGEDYAVSNSSAGQIEIGWSNISDFGDALSLGNGDVHDNYVHGLQSFIPLCGNGPCSYYEHTDDLISDGGDGAGLTVRHNTMFNQMTPQQGASAAIGLFADSGPVSNTTVDDNLIAGGAYALYPGGGSSSSNIVITGNHFSTIYWPGSGYYGADATSYWHSGGGNVWSGNIWDDGPHAGQAVQP